MAAAEPLRRSLTGNPLPDWRDGGAYLPLIGSDPSAFAWEWLRRRSEYQAAWSRCDHRCDRAARHARSFGLENLEDPALAVPHARPVWSRAVLPSVLTAHVTDIHAPRSDRVDLRLLAPFVTIVIGQNETEHLLFSDGRRFLRIDVVEGTLIGCPASLTYLLRGLTRLQGPIESLNRLARLVRLGDFGSERPASSGRHRRWIQELRVADALAEGNDQQGIARIMFGGRIAERRWRVENPSYRRQVQRLVSEARSKLLVAPGSWFQP